MNRTLRGLLAAMLLSAPSLFGAGKEYEVALNTDTNISSAELTRIRHQSIAILQSRFKDVCPTQIIPLDNGHLQVRLAPLRDIPNLELRRLIEARGVLEFRKVHPESARNLALNLLPPGYEVLTETRLAPDGTQQLQRYVVNQKPEQGLTSRYLKEAFVTRNPVTNDPEIHFELDEEGTRLFEEVTRELSPRDGQYHQLAIVLDGTLYSAPRILEPIPGGRGMISGSFTEQEAFNLASILSAPSLEASLSVVNEHPLDPDIERQLLQETRQAALQRPLMALLLLVVGFLAVILILVLGWRRAKRRAARGSLSRL